MEKEQIFEMPEPELGSLPPPTPPPPSNPAPGAALIQPQRLLEGLFFLFPCSQPAISSLPKPSRTELRARTLVSQPIPAETSCLQDRPVPHLSPHRIDDLG